MLLLDIRTVFVICTIFILLYGIGMLAFARKVSESFNGIYVFAVINFLIVIGLILAFLRGHISLFWSIIVSQALMMIASSLIYQANLQFIHYDKRPFFIPLILFISFLSLVIVFTYLTPNSNIRVIVINSFHCLQFSLTAWTIWRWQQQKQQTLYTPLIVISSLFALIIAVRIITLVFGKQLPPYSLPGDFLHSVQTIILMLYVATLDFSIVLISTHQLVDKISELAYKDYLTTLYNRRGLDYALNEKNTLEKSLAVILCDIDYFKLVNDRYGHHVGDVVLQKFAQLIKELTRKTDICVRWGGEEFLIILPLNNEQEAFRVAEKIRVACEKQRFPEQPELCFTSSFGVYLKKDNDSFNQLVHRADQALYQAKNKGRNRVCVC